MTKKKRQYVICHHFQQQRQRPTQTSVLLLISHFSIAKSHPSIINLWWEKFLLFSTFVQKTVVKACRLLSYVCCHKYTLPSKQMTTSATVVQLSGGKASHPSCFSIGAMVVRQWRVVRSSRPKRWGRRETLVSGEVWTVLAWTNSVLVVVLAALRKWINSTVLMEDVTALSSGHDIWSY